MPRGKHIPGATAKENRMYEHILDSSGDKGIAAATVNKFRSKKGETKKKKRGKK